MEKVYPPSVHFSLFCFSFKKFNLQYFHQSDDEQFICMNHPIYATGAFQSTLPIECWRPFALVQRGMELESASEETDKWKLAQVSHWHFYCWKITTCGWSSKMTFIEAEKLLKNELKISDQVNNEPRAEKYWKMSQLLNFDWIFAEKWLKNSLRLQFFFSHFSFIIQSPFSHCSEFLFCLILDICLARWCDVHVSKWQKFSDPNLSP